MADFDQLRQQLRNSRTARDDAAQTIAALQERIKQIAARQTELNRVFNPDNQQHVAERARLNAERERAERDLERQRGRRTSALADEAGLLKEFVRFTDPRQ